MNDPIRVGLAGLGTVGGGVAKVLHDQARALSWRAGRDIRITAVSARDARKDRVVDLAHVPFEADALALAERDDVDVVVELVGGEEGIARALVERALRGRKHVVTANKALLARHGGALAALAERHGVGLKFEAAICGGIPIVKALREGLISYDLSAVRGILNGTCNFILTQMEATRQPFAEVLAEAQRLGYAEADPTLDIGGGDTAHKLTLLTSLAFGTAPDLDGVRLTGIDRIAPADIAFAGEFGYRIKLLGVARRTPNGIEQLVNPAMVPASTPLADVESSFNAVAADAGEAGPFFFQGRGAGRGPTASAVVADLVDVARGALGPAFGRPAAELSTPRRESAEARMSAYYLRFQVLDVPGVMAEISRHLANELVSIESMIQRGRAPGEPVAIVMITHEAQHVAVLRALQAIGASGRVVEQPCMIPMEAA
ncbi:MAG: homoserine dehydrogenase [Alphaproteobacteria bacterium]|nr:homoserine dehydrogenase [Alphaproteobacteria bacterium]